MFSFINKLIVGVVAVLAVSGCSVGFNSDEFPASYDRVVAEPHWVDVNVLAEKQAALDELAMYFFFVGAELSDANREKVINTLDEFSYWKAVAEVSVYRGDYVESANATAKANAAAKIVAEIVLKAIEDVSPKGVGL